MFLLFSSHEGGNSYSAAKDLSLGRTQILRCAQDDSLWRLARFKKPPHEKSGELGYSFEEFQNNVPLVLLHI